MKAFFGKIFKFIDRLAEDHVGAYAAQSAFFLVLSLIVFNYFYNTIVNPLITTSFDSHLMRSMHFTLTTYEI